jgi:hypothetical protein
MVTHWGVASQPSVGYLTARDIHVRTSLLDRKLSGSLGQQHSLFGIRNFNELIRMWAWSSHSMYEILTHNTTGVTEENLNQDISILRYELTTYQMWSVSLCCTIW